ncbi:extracellular solute-binding protein [Paenibacillus spongiae]|uniref:Extracellular solute-binding protein n=1 Tax=Paenibacillus spongiae TaxID=2909671 RepID=A0ABY5S4X4_9BACL|nr:extracellular solute-binding protein [Paenibacillus spongiae]UVI28952.1 extracellular solute-binding protein [Paenibacillus spongiae]
MHHTSLKRYLIFAAAAMLLFMTACSSTANNKDATNKANSLNSQGTGNTGEQTAAADPLGKYETPIEVTTVRYLPPSIKFEKGDSIDSNIWYRSYEEELGIKLINKWSVPQTQWQQKMNVTIASGDIPDILSVTANELKRLVDADMVEDMTDVFEKYASDKTKKIINNDGGNGMKASTFEGKLLALPGVSFTGTGAQMLWIRQDWLKKLNLPEPKTMEDVYKIAEAFANQDPDGNNQKDTIGLGGINKDMNSLMGFFESFHAYPGRWIKDDSGQLVSGDIQPGLKPALQKLQEMFKAGLIDPEFAVKDQAKAYELIASNKAGMFYSGEGAVWWPLTDHYKKEKSDWKPYPLISFDDQPASTSGGIPVGNYYVVRKGFEHPEALVKLLNFAVEKQYGPEGRLDAYWYGGENKEINVSAFAAVIISDPLELINIHRGVQESVDAGKYIDNPIADVKHHYDLYQMWLSGKFADSNEEGQAWSSYKWAGPGGGMNVVSDYVKDNRYLVDEYTGPSTPTMTAKKSTLDKMKLEMFTKIIMGQSDISAFDTFMADWKKFGGDAITAEVNEWYKAKQ